MLYSTNTIVTDDVYVIFIIYACNVVISMLIMYYITYYNFSTGCIVEKLEQLELNLLYIRVKKSTRKVDMQFAVLLTIEKSPQNNFSHLAFQCRK